MVIYTDQSVTAVQEVFYLFNDISKHKFILIHSGRSSTSAGGRGGGVLHITVRDTLSVDGEICSDGKGSEDIKSGAGK